MYKIAITGGTGCIGQELTRQLYDKADRIVIISRSESRQAEMKQIFPEYPQNKMRYMIGDIRDMERMAMAFKGCDYIIHAAALKRVEVAEYDPREAIYTNILGTMNVAAACNIAGVKKAIFISTDKAVQAETLYGGSKFVAERYWISANNYGKCRFSAVRYANVEGSTGSLLKIWQDQIENGEMITVTDKRMTRMWISKEEAAKLVIDTLDIAQGGEVVVPHLEGKSIYKMALGYTDKRAINPQIREIGLRPCEKLHEVLIGESDARDCYRIGNKYVIYPAQHDWIKEYSKTGEKMPESFRLTSEVNCD